MQSTPLHCLVNDIGEDIVKHLSAVHALTGADCTSKIGTKTAMMELSPLFRFALSGFGDPNVELTQEVIIKVENLLVKSISKKDTEKTFLDLHLKAYNNYSKKDFDLARFPCSSGSAHEAIKRAHAQTLLWKTATMADRPVVEIMGNGTMGWQLVDGHLRPIYVQDQSVRPADLPPPCSCMKCARRASCACRQFSRPCCRFCKCHKDSPTNQTCNNPN